MTISTAARRSEEVTRLLPRPLRVIVIAVLLLVVLVPVLYMGFSSVSSDLSVAGGALLPTDLRLDNYLRVWSTVDLSGGLANSVLVAGAVAGFCALVSVGSAYVLVRHTFRGRLTIL